MKKNITVGLIVAGLVALAVVYAVAQNEMKDFEPDFEFDDIKDEAWG